MLREQQVERLVGEALRHGPNGRTIAEERVASFLAHELRLPLAEAAVERLNLEWCRRAWRALQGASYAEVTKHAQTYRPRKAA
ncbi:hypothetical protein [Methylorubrum aminovorans]|uniref:hypothetical protein n=1 Tax=Methylorubrum aminovorans TaxID=269069 RepID=UPI003C2F6B33